MNLGDLQGLRLGSRDALFVDFDGTLAEIIPDPGAVYVPSSTWAALEKLAKLLQGAVALLSGRDVRDLDGRTPNSLWRAGGHGLDILAPGQSPPVERGAPPESVLRALQAAAAIPGVRLELKGPVAALHFRAAPQAEGECIRAAERAARAAPGHNVQVGKMVVEVKPAAAHKGFALRAMLSRPPFVGRRPVMLGDDTTDEDAMAAAQELGGIAVKVGEGGTTARLRAPNPAAVRDWLEREAEAGLGG